MNNKQATEVIVLGGGYAGVLAALRLRRYARSENVTVTLVNYADHFVERIRLHQRAANQKLTQYPYASLLRGTGIRFQQGWVTGISPTQQTVTVHTTEGNVRMSYDYLIYALGSMVETNQVPGAAEYGLSLSTEATTVALQKQLPPVAGRGGRLLICGGGLTGIEAATELAESYPDLQVALVTSETFGEAVSQRGQSHLREAFERLGIEVIDRHTVTAVQPDHVVCDNGAVIPFDICLWAGSFTVSPLARHVGLPVNSRGQILVDERLRVKGWFNIYAIGDAASLEEVFDFPIRMACATAAPMGAFAGQHLASVIRGQRPAGKYRFRYVIRCISLGRRDGLVQFVTTDDTPQERVLTGWAGAKVKELICRSTIWNMQAEQKMTAFFTRGRKNHKLKRELIAEKAASNLR